MDSRERIENRVQDQIIELLESKRECSFGDMVKELNFSYNEILKNILALKHSGLVSNANSAYGYYTLSQA